MLLYFIFILAQLPLEEIYVCKSVRPNIKELTVQQKEACFERLKALFVLGYKETMNKIANGEVNEDNGQGMSEFGNDLIAQFLNYPEIKALKNKVEVTNISERNYIFKCIATYLVQDENERDQTIRIFSKLNKMNRNDYSVMSIDNKPISKMLKTDYDKMFDKCRNEEETLSKCFDFCLILMSEISMQDGKEFNKIEYMIQHICIRSIYKTNLYTNKRKYVFHELEIEGMEAIHKNVLLAKNIDSENQSKQATPHNMYYVIINFHGIVCKTSTAYLEVEERLSRHVLDDPIFLLKIVMHWTYLYIDINASKTEFKGVRTQNYLDPTQIEGRVGEICHLFNNNALKNAIRMKKFFCLSSTWSLMKEAKDNGKDVIFYIMHKKMDYRYILLRNIAKIFTTEFVENKTPENGNSHQYSQETLDIEMLRFFTDKILEKCQNPISDVMFASLLNNSLSIINQREDKKEETRDTGEKEAAGETMATEAAGEKEAAGETMTTEAVGEKEAAGETMATEAAGEKEAAGDSVATDAIGEATATYKTKVTGATGKTNITDTTCEIKTIDTTEEIMATYVTCETKATGAIGEIKAVDPIEMLEYIKAIEEVEEAEEAKEVEEAEEAREVEITKEPLAIDTSKEVIATNTTKELIATDATKAIEEAKKIIPINTTKEVETTNVALTTETAKAELTTETKIAIEITEYEKENEFLEEMKNIENVKFVDILDEDNVINIEKRGEILIRVYQHISIFLETIVENTDGMSEEKLIFLLSCVLFPQTKDKPKPFSINMKRLSGCELVFCDPDIGTLSTLQKYITEHDKNKTALNIEVIFLYDIYVEQFYNLLKDQVKTKDEVNTEQSQIEDQLNDNFCSLFVKEAQSIKSYQECINNCASEIKIDYRVIGGCDSSDHKCENENTGKKYNMKPYDLLIHTQNAIFQVMNKHPKESDSLVTKFCIFKHKFFGETPDCIKQLKKDYNLMISNFYPTPKIAKVTNEISDFQEDITNDFQKAFVALYIFPDKTDSQYSQLCYMSLNPYITQLENYEFYKLVRRMQMKVYKKPKAYLLITRATFSKHKLETYTGSKDFTPEPFGIQTTRNTNDTKQQPNDAKNELRKSAFSILCKAMNVDENTTIQSESLESQASAMHNCSKDMQSQNEVLLQLVDNDRESIFKDKFLGANNFEALTKNIILDPGSEPTQIPLLIIFYISASNNSFSCDMYPFNTEASLDAFRNYYMSKTNTKKHMILFLEKKSIKIGRLNRCVDMYFHMPFNDNVKLIKLYKNYKSIIQEDLHWKIDYNKTKESIVLGMKLEKVLEYSDFLIVNHLTIIYISDALVPDTSSKNVISTSEKLNTPETPNDDTIEITVDEQTSQEMQYKNSRFSKDNITTILLEFEMKIKSCSSTSIITEKLVDMFQCFLEKDDATSNYFKSNVSARKMLIEKIYSLVSPLLNIASNTDMENVLKKLENVTEKDVKSELKLTANSIEKSIYTKLETLFKKIHDLHKKLLDSIYDGKLNNDLKCFISHVSSYIISNNENSVYEDNNNKGSLKTLIKSGIPVHNGNNEFVAKLETIMKSTKEDTYLSQKEIDIQTDIINKIFSSSEQDKIKQIYDMGKGNRDLETQTLIKILVLQIFMLFISEKDLQPFILNRFYTNNLKLYLHNKFVTKPIASKLEEIVNLSGFFAANYLHNEYKTAEILEDLRFNIVNPKKPSAYSKNQQQNSSRKKHKKSKMQNKKLGDTKQSIATVNPNQDTFEEPSEIESTQAVKKVRKKMKTFVKYNDIAKLIENAKVFVTKYSEVKKEMITCFFESTFTKIIDAVAEKTILLCEQADTNNKGKLEVFDSSSDPSAESLNTTSDVSKLISKYKEVNEKLEKTNDMINVFDEGVLFLLKSLHKYWYLYKFFRQKLVGKNKYIDGLTLYSCVEIFDFLCNDEEGIKMILEISLENAKGKDLSVNDDKIKE